MPNDLFRRPHIGGDELNAIAIQDDTRDMLRQMMLPLIPERRVKGALSLVSRETGLPFSKLRRLYYGITNHILAVEWTAIKAAHRRWLDEREKTLAADLEFIRASREARKQREFRFDGNTTDDPRAAAVAVGQAAEAD